MKLGLLFFLLVPILGNGYVLWRIWHLLPLALPWKVLVTVALVLAVAGMFLFLGKKDESLPLDVASFVYQVSNSWLILMFYLVLLFLLLDIGRWVHLVPSSFLQHSWKGTAFVAVVITALFVYGNFRYRQKVRQPLTLTVSRPLPRPLRVVLLSDLHLGYHNRRTEFARWVDLVNAERPDLILIAGDIIDISARPLLEEGTAAEFRRLVAPVYACLGNHEYYSGGAASARFFREAGIRLLCDSVAEVGDALYVIGRDDRTNPHRRPLRDLVAGLDPRRVTLLLDHQPYRLEEAEQAGIDFQFSGHTHHGQVWPASWLTEAIYEKAFGEHRRGKTRYYVSSGIGIWGGKFRLGTRSEYVVLTLQN